MDKPSRSMLRTLRQAQLYGYLIPRGDSFFHPGGHRPLCSPQDAQRMVRSGWLTIRDGRYEITHEGQDAAERALDRSAH